MILILNNLDDPDKTISNIDNNELIMAYYYQLTNIQIFPDERLDVILKYFDFAKKSGLENIAYAITEKIIETFNPSADIFSNWYRNCFCKYCE